MIFIDQRYRHDDEARRWPNAPFRKDDLVWVISKAQWMDRVCRVFRVDKEKQQCVIRVEGAGKETRPYLFKNLQRVFLDGVYRGIRIFARVAAQTREYMVLTNRLTPAAAAAMYPDYPVDEQPMQAVEPSAPLEDPAVVAIPVEDEVEADDDPGVTARWRAKTDARIDAIEVQLSEILRLLQLRSEGG
jgi:hypothetical protein